MKLADLSLFLGLSVRPRQLFGFSPLLSLSQENWLISFCFLVEPICTLIFFGLLRFGKQALSLKVYLSTCYLHSEAEGLSNRSRLIPHNFNLSFLHGNGFALCETDFWPTAPAADVDLNSFLMPKITSTVRKVEGDDNNLGLSMSETEFCLHKTVGKDRRLTFCRMEIYR